MKARIISTFGRKYVSDDRPEFDRPYRDGAKWCLYVYIRRFEIEVEAWTMSELEEKLRYVSPLKAAQRVYDSLSITDQLTFGERPYESYDYDIVEVIEKTPKRDEAARELRGLRRDLREAFEGIGDAFNEALESAKPTMPTVQSCQPKQPQPQPPVQPDPMQQLQAENANLHQQLAGMSQAMQRLTEQMAYLQGQLDANKPKAEKPENK